MSLGWCQFESCKCVCLISEHYKYTQRCFVVCKCQKSLCFMEMKKCNELGFADLLLPHPSCSAKLTPRGPSQPWRQIHQTRSRLFSLLAPLEVTRAFTKIVSSVEPNGARWKPLCTGTSASSSALRPKATLVVRSPLRRT